MLKTLPLLLFFWMTCFAQEVQTLPTTVAVNRIMPPNTDLTQDPHKRFAQLAEEMSHLAAKLHPSQRSKILNATLLCSEGHVNDSFELSVRDNALQFAPAMESRSLIRLAVEAIGDPKALAKQLLGTLKESVLRELPARPGQMQVAQNTPQQTVPQQTPMQPPPAQQQPIPQQAQPIPQAAPQHLPQMPSQPPPPPAADEVSGKFLFAPPIRMPGASQLVEQEFVQFLSIFREQIITSPLHTKIVDPVRVVATLNSQCPPFPQGCVMVALYTGQVVTTVAPMPIGQGPNIVPFTQGTVQESLNRIMQIQQLTGKKPDLNSRVALYRY